MRERRVLSKPNLFQAIKAVRAEAAARGIKIIDLSIGQPAGCALLSARQAASEAVLSTSESMHEYQDNGCCIPNWAKRFVAGHLKIRLLNEGIDYLPIPGIKPMLGIIIQACGDARTVVATTTNPGYPTPRDQCELLGRRFVEPAINPGNSFLFDPENLDIYRTFVSLVMLNYPHNPSSAISGRDWLRAACKYCQGNHVRMFNDAAYGALGYADDTCLLSEVAWEFPDLSWAEAFSVSKLIGNGTGWRIGAMVGSADFIADIKDIKGKNDSGFAAFVAAGALYALENDRASIAEIALMYRRRTRLLCETLSAIGMHLALEPRAGFFTLWKTPKRAFGKEMKDAADFNLAMINNTGVVGVPFGDYIRYAVAHDDVASIAGEIKAAFAKAEVSY
jgi:LL-diaminopimelate aminotransferase